MNLELEKTILVNHLLLLLAAADDDWEERERSICVCVCAHVCMWKRERELEKREQICCNAYRETTTTTCFSFLLPPTPTFLASISQGSSSMEGFFSATEKPEVHRHCMARAPRPLPHLLLSCSQSFWAGSTALPLCSRKQLENVIEAMSEWRFLRKHLKEGVLAPHCGFSWQFNFCPYWRNWQFKIPEKISSI